MYGFNLENNSGNLPNLDQNSVVDICVIASKGELLLNKKKKKKWYINETEAQIE